MSWLSTTDANTPESHLHLLCLVLGAAGVRRAALSEAVLPALLQCIQGPCDHHVWGEAACPLPDLCTTVGLGGLPPPSMWSLDLGHRHGLVAQQVPSAVGIGWG